LTNTGKEKENAKTPKYCGHYRSQLTGAFFSFRSNPHVMVVYECVLVQAADVISSWVWSSRFACCRFWFQFLVRLFFL